MWPTGQGLRERSLLGPRFPCLKNRDIGLLGTPRQCLTVASCEFQHLRPPSTREQEWQREDFWPLCSGAPASSQTRCANSQQPETAANRLASPAGSGRKVHVGWPQGQLPTNKRRPWTDPQAGATTNSKADRAQAARRGLEHSLQRKPTRNLEPHLSSFSHF